MQELSSNKLLVTKAQGGKKYQNKKKEEMNL